MSRRAAFAAVLLAAGCSSPGSPSAVSYGIPSLSQASLRSLYGHGAIDHIVVIVQENRTVDNLFNGFPGADTAQSGKNSRGQTLVLQPISLTAPYDLSHKHGAWVTDYDHGRMDGFNEEGRNCYSNGHCPDRHKAAYGYVPRNEVKPYWAMAELYTFADEMFASNEGPSFPAHQYLISGTSTITNRSIYKAAENPTDPRGKRRQGGCNSLHEAVVETIDPAGKQSKPVYPCFNRDSLMQLMNAHGVSWRYYQEFGGSGEWHAVDAIEPIWKSASYANVMWPSERVLRDVAAGELADVTFVTPSAIDSDHSGRNNGTGPSWVSSIVNTIGESPYWDHTAIIVTWDDWGGWYDHVVPHRFNSYEVSFRVPMIVISPYAKRGHVSHVKYEFGSILKYVEQTFKLGSLHTTDVRSNDLSDCFDFAGRPSAFTPIPAAYSAQYFEQLPVDYDSPDDDN